jgi:hypothetical protein
MCANASRSAGEPEPGSLNFRSPSGRMRAPDDDMPTYRLFQVRLIPDNEFPPCAWELAGS